MSKRIYPVTVKDGELVEVDEKLTVNGLPISKNGTIDAADVSGDVGGGAFEDTDGDDVAELQTAHADAQGGDIRNVGAFDADEQSITSSLTTSKLSANQTVSTGTITKVQFDTALTDDLNAFDSMNYEVDIPRDGKYLITGFIRWNKDTGWSTGDIASIRPFVNGSAVFATNRAKVGTDTQGISTPPIIVPLVAGDVVDVRAYQTSGADQAIDGQNGNSVRSRFVVSQVA